MKAMINWCRLPIKAPEEHKEEIKKASARPAAAKETSIDAAIVTVLSDGGGIFTLQVKQIIGSEVILSGQHVFNVFSLLPTGFVKSSAKHCGT